MKSKKSKRKNEKHFYNNKQRNQKWTEQETGRYIDFADKYSPDKKDGEFDESRVIANNIKLKKERKKKTAKKIVSVILAIVIVCIGYTGADVYMTRHARPAEQRTKQETTLTNNISQINMSIASYQIESVSLDGSVMLSSIISDLEKGGFSSVTFDAKRTDGSIGYASKLASVDTFGAVSASASQPQKSIKQMVDHDILPIARICCYRDNVVPLQSQNAAVMQNGKVYKDSDGYTYLNPDSDFAYNYIKDIVSELKDYGVTVFVLTGCDLPKDAGGKYNDGFDYISKRLNNDFNGEIRLYEEVDVEINDENATENTIAEEIKKFDSISKNQIYCISTKVSEETLIPLLSRNNITRYILKD